MEVNYTGNFKMSTPLQPSTHRICSPRFPCQITVVFILSSLETKGKIGLMMFLGISEGEKQRCNILDYRAGNLIIAKFHPLQSSSHQAFLTDQTEALAKAILSFSQFQLELTIQYPAKYKNHNKQRKCVHFVALMEIVQDNTFLLTMRN